MKNILFTVFIVLSTIGYSQQSLLESNSDKGSSISDYIEHLIKRQGIPEIALAIIKDDELIHKNNFGYANIEHQVPISDKSIFRLYSLTEPVVVVGIFQLIEDGKLSLDDAVSKYVFDLPDNWNDIKIKHLLMHSSGIPDMMPLSDFKYLSEEEAKNKIFEQDIRFNQGEKYDYNQTGFWLLQEVIEKVTGEDLANFILKGQFSDSKYSFFSSDSRDIVLNRVTPYFPFTKGGFDA